MDMTIDQQVALNEALVPHASRLRISKSNFRLRSDIKSKESTLQVATAIVHHQLICFKMNNKKRIVNLEYFREMLQISPRIPNQQFDELPFEEEILAFLRELGHSGEIKMITNVMTVFACLKLKSFGGMYHKKNVDFAYLLWEDFMYQVEHKDAKKSNEMYYPRFTKVIINFFMTKDQSIPRRNKQPAKTSTAKGLTVLSEVILAEAKQIKLATKRSLTQTHILHASRSGTDKGTGIIPGVLDVPAYESNDEEISWKSNADDDDDEVKIREHDDDDQDDDQGDDDDEQSDSDNDGDDFVHPKFLTHDEEAKDEESFDPIVRTHSHNDDDEDNDEDSDWMNMNEAVKVAVQIQLDRLRDEAQAENEDFINKLDKNIPKIIKEQVKEQVKDQVSKILTKIDKTIESNKSIYIYDEQKNLYKALVDAYEFDKLILDTYRDTVTLKRCRDDEDKDEELSAGSNRGSKRRREGKEPDSTTTQKEKTSKTSGKGLSASHWFQKQAKPPTPDRAWNKNLPATHGRIQPWISNLAKKVDSHTSFNELMDTPVDFSAFVINRLKKQAKPPTPDRAWNKNLPATHGRIQPWISNLAKKVDSHTSFNELMDTPVDFSAFVINRLKVDTLTPELLAGPTYELIKGSFKSLVELEFFLEEVYKETTDQLDWNNPEGQQYPHDLLKPLPLIPNSWGVVLYLSITSSTTTLSVFVVVPQAFNGFMVNRESARDGYSKRRIIAVTELQIVEWHNYKHLD
uniref:Uncharacterized protein n=1 Tax=Tanacetum cinerariifolium TaxID=118510 RepID=A0A6L2N9U7_TANCI|nr:hypothetical protein [Tanacetum cinerariifolium]